MILSPFQYREDGDATQCCAKNQEGIPPPKPVEVDTLAPPSASPAIGRSLSNKVRDHRALCYGTANICRHFYDSAPTGMFGTMIYLLKASCEVLTAVPEYGEIDCSVS